MIILVALAVLAALVLFALWPSTGQKGLRAPFEGRNFAHRGLFGKSQRPPENSLPAFEAAAAAGYGIELDVQFTRDKQVLVFHDDNLDRMTKAKGWVRDFSYEQIIALGLEHSAEHAPLFSEVLATVAGRVPLIVEIKSRTEYSGAYLDELCAAVLGLLEGYEGAYCIESFDPRVVQRIRKAVPCVLRGQLVDTYKGYRQGGANILFAFAMSHCFVNFLGRPHFVAWGPAKRNPCVRLCDALGAMMVYWTALPKDDAEALQAQYDAVIFQWYHPEPKYEK